MRSGYSLWFGFAFAVTISLSSVALGQQAPPPLQAGIDLLTIDVQITPAKEAPLPEFAATDFDVSISGRPRAVVSATRLHLDAGAVTRDSSPGSATGTADCVFGFRRTTDRPTVHYVLAVEATEADRKNVSNVKVKVVNKAFTVQAFQWRSPIRRRAMAIP